MFSEVLESLVELPDHSLDRRIREIELERRRLDAELAAAIAVADHRQLPAVDGHRSINAYLRATLNCSSAEASRLRGLASAVDRVDGLGEAWFAGRFGQSQAARFAGLHGNRRVRDRLAEFAPVLLDHAERLPYSDFAVCVDRFVALADVDGAHDARDDAVEHRNAHVTDVGGMLDVKAHGGDGLTTAELVAIHERFTEHEYRHDLEARRSEHGDRADCQPFARTAAQRRFDALVAIFRAAAGADRVGTPADPLVNIVVDVDTWSKMLLDAGLAPDVTLDGREVDPFTGLSDPTDLLAELVDGPVSLTDRRCETTSGVEIHPHDLSRAALAGHVRRVIVDADGVAVDMGRRKRLFTGPARDAAKLLVRRCEHPGCELPADWCEVDHATEWAAGGTTDQSNSRIRCDSHNNQKTQRRWRSRRALDGRTYTVRDDGTVMLPVGVRSPVFPDDDADDHADARAAASWRARTIRIDFADLVSAA